MTSSFARFAVVVLSLLADMSLLPAQTHAQHVFFDNSAAAECCYNSDAAVVAPSDLEIIDGKAPIESAHFKSPPNSLRLKWTSAPGGDWRVTLRVMTRYGRRFEFNGDTLSLWCFATEELTSDTAPRIYLRDESGVGVPTISLLAPGVTLPEGRWVQLKLPFASFRGSYGGTDDVKFDGRTLAAVTLVQNFEDAQPHTLYIDDVSVIDGNAQDTVPPAGPTELFVKGQARHFDISWQPPTDADVKNYRIYRSLGGNEFVPVATRPAWSNRHVDFVAGPAVQARYKVSAIDVHENESPHSEPAGDVTRELDDQQLLDMVQEGCFRYYWDVANPDSGMALEILPGDPNLVAVGASGFGILAQLVATERGFITRDQSTERMLKIVRYLKRSDRFHGALPHFLDGRTARVNPYFGKYDNGGDLVETAFLVQGLLAARQYYDKNNDAEREIRDTITQMWRDVEWDWYRKTPDSDVLYWHWSPDHGWHISHPLIGWNETLIVYLLAVASPTHPVPASLYHTGFAGQSDHAVQYRRWWSRTTDGQRYVNGNSYYGIKLDVGMGTGGDLFFTQFSFLGFDPRGIRDRYTNYFHNNRNIALINREYCIANPRKHVGYGPACWGLSAGVNSGGGRPLPRDDNGTICSSAALGCFPYTPDESMAALKHFYYDLGDRIWGPYGFHDGFNQTQKWFDEVYMGLNQAQIVVGIENQRSGLLWKLFMRNPEIAPALAAIGFKTDKTVNIPQPRAATSQ